MAYLANTRLSLTFITGYNEEGEPIFKVKSFNNIEPSTENEQLFSTAAALASLQKYDVEKIERSNTYELVN
ncbi:DUF1659 domain-containing protein [Evansella cellulosilytica]|uniref:DUF1659 domain-containing protein n=1 Tax=Evansella cellulosilytica (strain ATCC 21833 / DSM 2522 / FERM P-1141 / JCM 9156 / N-4) TaxID=649639 RepID=E6TY22_EVAC2|nr:DUF1659 domain-containing protein [Evansella cellulosilytica]ADU31235.1 protein of unknown function DUF1659 [Evansella cellulosilytica DSM 2522]